MKNYLIAIICCLSILSACKEDKVKEKNLEAPIAEKIPHKTVAHGVTLIDDYHWLRDQDWPKVDNSKIIKHLEAENDYFASHMNDYKDLQNELFKEIKGRIQEKDYTVPVKKDDYYYYSYINAGDNYWTVARKKGDLKAVEEIVLDQNLLAKGKKYFKIDAHSISLNHKLLAYSVDDSGDESYTIHIKDLSTGKLLEDKIPNTKGNVVWHNNNEGFFYLPLDNNWRTREVKYHKLGSKDKDSSIYYEKDPTFCVGISKTPSHEYILIASSSPESSEIRYMEANSADLAFKLFMPRKDKILYNLLHKGDFFYSLINDKGPNFRLVKIPINNTAINNWYEMIPVSSSKYLESIFAYQNFFVLQSRINGLPIIEIIDETDGSLRKIAFEDEVYDACVSYTDFNDPKLRYSYSSLKNPFTILQFDPELESTEILKVQEIPSGFNKDHYITQRIWVKARDGVQVPVSILYNKNKAKIDGTAPLYLYGYGSYGIAIHPHFRSSIFSLVDRGYIYAIAHIRGGDDLGFEWYEKAKFLNKKKTFTDFIDVSVGLINQNYTAAGNIVICGGSAGGLLMGVVLNERPELYKAAILDVPFVDVLNTMLDDSLPLTPGEFKEWGNPKQKDFFNYIRSYSPYDNIKAQSYPHIFVSAGLYDPRVTYWEPAKYVAKLRANKLGDNLLLLKTNMAAGHGGKSGRYQMIEEIAEEYTLILGLFSKEKT